MARYGAGMSGEGLQRWRGVAVAGLAAIALLQPVTSGAGIPPIDGDVATVPTDPVDGDDIAIQASGTGCADSDVTVTIQEIIPWSDYSEVVDVGDVSVLGASDGTWEAEVELLDAPAGQYFVLAECAATAAVDWIDYFEVGLAAPLEWTVTPTSVAPDSTVTFEAEGSACPGTFVGLDFGGPTIDPGPPQDVEVPVGPDGTWSAELSSSVGQEDIALRASCFEEAVGVDDDSALRHYDYESVRIAVEDPATTTEPPTTTTTSTTSTPPPDAPPASPVDAAPTFTG